MENSLEKILINEFGLAKPTIKKINGYENANYQIKTERGSYIFKTYKYEENLLAIIEAENQILQDLAKSRQNLYPNPISFKNGDSIKLLELDGRLSICRMLTFLEGQFLAEARYNEKIYESLGEVLAKMNQQLSKSTSYILKARKWEWDLQYFHLNKEYLPAITDTKDRNLVLYFFQQYEEEVVPKITALRKQIIHNDANEWNILTNNNKVTGIIDFGDLAHSYLINEVAIAMTYAGYGKEHPFKDPLIVLKAYHTVNPLLEKEISLLYYLIAARLCTSVCNSARSRQLDPENSYAAISEESAWKTLKKWVQFSPKYIENKFRQAVGFKSIRTTPIKKVLLKRHQHISTILSLSYEHPIHMERSAFQYMHDAHGNTFLDAYNNIPHVGHSHPKIVEAGQRQMAKLNTNTRYAYDLLGNYAEKLLSKFPNRLTKVFFVNSGSAASDLAIRMAKAHTHKTNLMVMEHGYHGNTQLAIDVSDYKFNNPMGQGQQNHIIKTTLPDAYRGKFTDKNVGKRYAKEAIENLNKTQKSIAAFISEPIVGCGGQVPLAPNYLKELYPEIRKQGALCISDEVQTGFGRLGSYFWGFEMHGVVPDIVVLGKPMGNGHPIGAVVVTNEIAASFEKGVEFFSSFGGNPVSCAIGMAVLEVIEEDGLQQNAAEVGDYYKSLLKELQAKNSCIGDVRGEGLFLGIDIVKDGSKETDGKLASTIKNELRNQYILVSTDGPDDNVIKTKPPLCFTKQNAEEVVERIDAILKKRTH
ncbi:aminotransferase class III-fold pyridoxal phosphate-dependent enzyme [uncultured Croceitalea sp.]|uniref:aminotransferase class III-fold pyridoxal phosphate-dependent enzyme n=1 Tax=uncultured Croceitalea sp. TaxID=1798908 RepID=UPI0033064593